MRFSLAFASIPVLAACATTSPARSQPRVSVQRSAAEPARPAEPAAKVERSRDEAITPPSKADPHAQLVAWMRSRLPQGGDLDGSGGRIEVTHTVRAGDTLEKIALAYVELTDVYLGAELAPMIAKKNGLGRRALAPGAKIAIPELVTEVPPSPEKSRMPPPEDGAVRGLYMRGSTAARAMFTSILDHMAERGMNAIVLDAKDYDGWLTYPSKVPLANEAGAVKNPPIRDLSRTIRFAHKKGIRVAVRVSCFEDEIVAKAKPALSVQAKWKRAYPIGWLDPSNEGAQGYIIDIVKEAMDAGADEIQLDYVRYPVLGIKGADFHLQERGLTQTTVIRDFVHKVHGITSARHIPLSLDVFGVISFGHRVDIDALGQDPALLAPECEALSPMVYPSHYSKGFNGWDEPGDHPEIVGIGTRGVREQIAAAGVKGGAVIRPWLQAMNYRSPAYSPKYLADEIGSGDAAGGTGWLMWNPGQDYSYAWTAVPKRKAADDKPAPSAKR